jgi:hypothetical protein
VYSSSIDLSPQRRSVDYIREGFRDDLTSTGDFEIYNKTLSRQPLQVKVFITKASSRPRIIEIWSQSFDSLIFIRYFHHLEGRKGKNL